MDRKEQGEKRKAADFSSDDLISSVIDTYESRECIFTVN